MEHTVVPQGMGHRIQPGSEPMVVLSLADFSRLEPFVPVRVSFLQRLAKKKCDDVGKGKPHCDVGSRCASCWFRVLAEGYLAMSGREAGPL